MQQCCIVHSFTLFPSQATDFSGELLLETGPESPDLEVELRQ